MASFNHFLDVFSAQDERINFSSFACCQASWDTSLEYPQRVLSRKKYFHFIKGLGNFLGPNRKPKWPKNIFLAPESYYLHINTWNFTRSRIQTGILGFSLRLIWHRWCRKHLWIFFMAQNITSLPYSDQQASICEKADRMHSSLLPAPYFVFQVFPYSPHPHVSPL